MPPRHGGTSPPPPARSYRLLSCGTDAWTMASVAEARTPLATSSEPSTRGTWAKPTAARKGPTSRSADGPLQSPVQRQDQRVAEHASVDRPGCVATARVQDRAGGGHVPTAPRGPATDGLAERPATRRRRATIATAGPEDGRPGRRRGVGPSAAPPTSATMAPGRRARRPMRSSAAGAGRERHRQGVHWLRFALGGRSISIAATGEAGSRRERRPLP